MPEREGAGHPPPMQQDTYIVQFPRDQVYYVPPPENALFLRRHPQSPKSSNTKCCPLSSTLALILLSILVILVLAITTIITLCFLYKPIQPSFSVANFTVVNSSRTLLCQISLTVNNPNTRTGIRYPGDTGVSLLLNNTVVAMGKFPGFEQDPVASTKAKIELKGKTSGNGNEEARGITYDLEMRIGVKNTAVGLTFGSMQCKVACKFKVRKLGDDALSLVPTMQCQFLTVREHSATSMAMGSPLIQLINSMSRAALLYGPFSSSPPRLPDEFFQSKREICMIDPSGVHYNIYNLVFFFK